MPHGDYGQDEEGVPMAKNDDSKSSEVETEDENEEEDARRRKRRAVSSNLKPVLVYIHSGIFMYGSISSPELDPSNLTTMANIVVVHIQYRLGSFGYASFDGDMQKQNHQSLALQDQAKAIEWVRTNIRAFGGDPERITLAGHGAGAVSIGFHLMNPNVNKLFKRVILQGKLI